MNLSKLVNGIPVLIIVAIGAFTMQNPKAPSVALLSENKRSMTIAIPNTSTGIDPSVNLPEYEVVENSVHDGDTMRVRSLRDGTSSHANEVLKIRFACIDAPELKQQLGQESRNYLRSLVNEAGGKVKVNIVDTDRYGRSVAEVWVKKGLVQSYMTSNGMAFAYDQYKKNCPHWDSVKSAEQVAIENKVGVWASPNFIKPWDWRRANK